MCRYKNTELYIVFVEFWSHASVLVMMVFGGDGDGDGSGVLIPLSVSGFCCFAPAFAEVWTDSFSQKLAIREKTQHSKCATCTRHKAIIKRLGNDSNARRSQALEFSAHLSLQYRDRVAYWEARSQSRLREPLPSGLIRITMITDGMDKSKFRYPRAKALGSKEFDGLIRPALDMVATIVHGYSITVLLSEPFVAKDSSSTCDAVLHSLDRLAGAGVDLRKVSLHLQADNTSREVKNNTLLRMGGALVASHRLHDLRICNLRAGHSHEDVDGFFQG
jgi:hypothetical protein